MTQKTRAAVETEIASLLADNGTGAITAANVRTVVNDMCDSALFTLTDAITPYTFAGLVLSNGTALTTDTTTAHTALIQGYSTTAVGYITLGTLTNGASATLALNAPTNGVLTIDNATIGGTTPAAAHFTTVSATGVTTLTGGALLANGQAITTDTTNAHTAVIQAYSTTASAYKSLATLTNGAVADLSLKPADANSTVTMFDCIDQGFKRCTSTLTATSNTALATATGLSIALSIGTYYIRGHLMGTAVAAGGIKAQLIASGGLVLSAAEITGVNYNGTTTNARTTVTALAADFANSAAAYTDVEFEGTLVVSTAGTVNLQAAQNTSNGTSTTVLAGSTMFVKRIA